MQDTWEEECDWSPSVSMQGDIGSLELKQRKNMENTDFIGESQLSHQSFPAKGVKNSKIARLLPFPFIK